MNRRIAGEGYAGQLVRRDAVMYDDIVSRDVFHVRVKKKNKNFIRN